MKSPQAGQLAGVDQCRHRHDNNDAVTYICENTRTSTHIHRDKSNGAARLRHNWANFLLTPNCHAYEISRFERRNKQWQHNCMAGWTNGRMVDVWGVNVDASRWRKHANGRSRGRCIAQYSSAALVARIKCVANRYFVPPNRKTATTKATIATTSWI